MFTPLSEIGVTTQKENQFIKKGIQSVEELAEFLPIGYRDYRNSTPVKSLQEGAWTTVHGTVVEKDGSHPKVCYVIIKDQHGDEFRINWFGNGYFFNLIHHGETYYFCGKISVYGFTGRQLCMNMPEDFSLFKNVLAIRPRYSSIKGMSRDYLLGKIAKSLVAVQQLEDDIQRKKVVQSLGLIKRYEALKEIHQPSDKLLFQRARLRLAFDVLYDFYQDLIVINKSEVKSCMTMATDAVMQKFVSTLPFDLTTGQVNALGELSKTLMQGERLSSLLLGDVGSGKTVVAASLAALVAENGYQAALLSPTRVLAGQNYKVMKEYLEPLGYHVSLLTSSLKTKERREVLHSVQTGKTHIIVGTHSILSEDVQFSDLGLAVIDEEHRFGVKQKEAMARRIKQGVSSLSMSATPIPRSLALSIYGTKMKVYAIRSKPKGRLPILTSRVDAVDRAYDQIADEVAKGRQAYIICPLIENSESEVLEGVDSVVSALKEARAKMPGLKIEKISGDMKSEEIEKIINRFYEGITQVLISTTIVEVGVNVPNASIIVIRNAERFGLAQLHQLRGRVGRGSHQSHCLLVSKGDTERLDVLEKTNDGFEIAEEDLRLRGSGALSGVIQTGYSREVETVLKFPKLAKAIRKELQCVS